MDIRARAQRKENSTKKREDKGRIYDNTPKSNRGHVLCELKFSVYKHFHLKRDELMK